MLRAEDLTVEGVVASYDPESDLDRHAASNLIAYVAELERHGVVISDLDHEIDADGGGALSFRFKIGDHWALRALMPGVPLEWMKRPAEFVEELNSAEWYGIYVDGDLDLVGDVGAEHRTWEDAVEAGVHIARAAVRG